jgi:hypothetical protein
LRPVQVPATEAALALVANFQRRLPLATSSA